MSSLLKQSVSRSFCIVTGGIFAFVPESFWGLIQYKCLSKDWNLLINRCVILLITFVLVSLLFFILRKLRKSLTFSGDNYQIKVKYGNLFEMKGYKVIAFDECYTTTVGKKPYQINQKSICGQFLSKHPDIDIATLIFHTGLINLETPSEYNYKIRYESGSLVPYNGYLLLAFAKLNKEGLGIMSREEYLKCLSKLWEEIDKYYGQEDIFIPVLGAGVTRFQGNSLTQQQLVDIMIASYQLSSHKIKKPNTLTIVCSKSKDFSLNKIGQYI